MERDRSYRRYQAERAKRKAAWFAHYLYQLDRPSKIPWAGGLTWEQVAPGWIGRTAAMHCSCCSCPQCGNPRRHFGQRTRQELIHDLTYQELLDSIR